MKDIETYAAENDLPQLAGRLAEAREVAQEEIALIQSIEVHLRDANGLTPTSLLRRRKLDDA